MAAAMKRLMGDAGHLVRLAAILGIGLVLFLGVRAAVVPKSFGQYGHYRGASLEEIRNRPVSYAGRATCESCHDSVVETRKGSRHEKIACEACHGPQARHAEDFTSVKPPRPDATALCTRCHEQDPARPMSFPQVVSKSHAGEVACNTCHSPHRPKP
jgi:hypothetical protein